MAIVLFLCLLQLSLFKASLRKFKKYLQCLFGPVLRIVLVWFSSVSRSHHMRPKELERSFLQKLDRKEESQHHFKCATEALQVLMRQIFEDSDISAEMKLATGSEITVHLQLLLNIQSHKMGDTRDFQHAVRALCEPSFK